MSIDLCLLCFVCFFFVPQRFYSRKKKSMLYGVLIYVCVLFVFEACVFARDKALSLRQLMRVYILLIGGGAIVFYLLYIENEDNFRGRVIEGHELGDFVYFAVITGSTTGYGDITPATVLSRRIVSCFVVLCMAINIFIINTSIQKIWSSTSISDETKRSRRAMDRRTLKRQG
jgi:hypothetical protein